MEERVLVRPPEHEQARDPVLFKGQNHCHLMREVFNMSVAELDVCLPIYGALVDDDQLLQPYPELIAQASGLGEIINYILQAAGLQMLFFKNDRREGYGLPELRLVLIGEAEVS